MGKISQILSCSQGEASEAMESFLRNIDGLYSLKKERIPQMAKKGGFTGLDGRFVKCSSEHLMLAGILQNGEAVAMKYWTVEWRKQAKADGLWFKHVNFVHDEVQVEVRSMEDAEHLKKIQSESMQKINEMFDVFCPFDVETNIGKNWAQSH